MNSLTHDRFLSGNILLDQPKSGYRFSIDAVLLSHLACPQAGDRIMDLGTGCGVIPIMLAYRQPDVKVIGVEIQTALSDLAGKNVAVNRMQRQIRILNKDMTQLSVTDIGGPVDLVVSNPPYRRLGSGRISADRQKAVARHELRVNLASLLSTAYRMLDKSGRFAIIYPSLRTVDLVTTMRSVGIEPKSMTMIHSNTAGPARLVFVSGVKSGGTGLEISPPIYLYNEDGAYTESVQRMLSD